MKALPTSLPKEVEILQKLWESYIAMSTFFSNLVGATLASLIALPIIKDKPDILKNEKMIVGIGLIGIALLISIAWRWASQWAMEIEIMGGNEGIDKFFRSARRPRVITGAKSDEVQWLIEEKTIPVLRTFMKFAAGLILCSYLSGLIFIIVALRQ